MKKISILLITLFLMFPLMINSNVKADIGDITIEDWEDYNVGVTSGTGSYVNWSRNSGDVILSNVWVEAGKSLSLTGADGDVDDANITLLSEYDYIRNIEIYYAMEYSDADDKYWSLEFYSSNNTLLLEILLYADNSVKNARYKDVLSNTYDISNDVNASGGLSGSNVGYGMTSYNWTTFSYIIVDENYATNTPADAHLYIDDIVINTNQGSASTETGVTGVICDGCCENVQLGTTQTYTVEVLGDVGCVAYFRIMNSTGSQKFLYPCPKGTTTFDVYFPFSWGTGNYTQVIFDDYLLFYSDDSKYYETCTFDIVSNQVIQNYTDYYGGFFTEWYTDGTECYYNIGDDATVVYYLDDSYLDADQIYRAYIVETLTGSSQWAFNINLNMLDTLNTFTFGAYGQQFTNATSYHIEVYNMTFSGFLWTKDSLVYTSESIRVCDEDVNLNQYSITLSPNKNTYAYTDEVNITIVKRGEDVGSYRITSPIGETIYSDLLYYTKTINLDFSDYSYGDNNNIKGEWVIHVFDRYGSPMDYNSVSKYINVDEVEEYPILPELDSRIGIVVGFIITIFCTLSPMIVAGLINSNARTSINVPPTAYAITGALGVVVSVGLGFFPSWIIFFIVAVGIIISVFMYLNGNRGG